MNSATPRRTVEETPPLIRTNWAPEAGDLIQITITLQRMKATRAVGLDLFETLLDAGAYEADQVLRDVDRRIT